MQVLEVTPGPNKVATIAYSDPNIDVNYPKKAAGVPYEDATANKIYQKTVDVFTTELSFRFFKHNEEDESAIEHKHQGCSSCQTDPPKTSLA